MIRRLLEAVLALVVLVICSPVMAIAAISIRRASPGSVLYRARRIGRHGREFTMYKLRTMHLASDRSSPITADGDTRVFPLGAWLRKTKVDELPQLWNIVRGEMAFVGPRAEDPGIVARYYTQAQKATLTVRPGLSSPGSLYYYTHGERLLTGDDVEIQYIAQVLPIKLAIDMVYVEHASLAYDIRVVWRTLVTILQMARGRREFPEPAELRRALELLAQQATDPQTA